MNDEEADVNRATTIEDHAVHCRAYPAAEAIADAASGETAAVRELDHRCNGGIDVRLLWEAQTNRVSLALTNEHSGESLSFEVDPSEALAAFYHPYVYADRAGS
jgi:hypothetical protein